MIANERESLIVFLKVSCLPTVGVYCGNKSLKFNFKMARYTEEQRTKIVELYFSCNRSTIAVQISYKNISNDGSSPNKNCIKAMVIKFQRNRIKSSC